MLDERVKKILNCQKARCVKDIDSLNALKIVAAEFDGKTLGKRFDKAVSDKIKGAFVKERMKDSEYHAIEIYYGSSVIRIPFRSFLDGKKANGTKLIAQLDSEIRIKQRIIEQIDSCSEDELDRKFDAVYESLKAYEDAIDDIPEAIRDSLYYCHSNVDERVDHLIFGERFYINRAIRVTKR